jgi:predicted Rossmann fold flavoprotein
VYDLIVIGGGAAGFFGAIQAAEMKPGFKILILEKSQKLLSKVRVSGGGRCNVTHHCFGQAALSKHYPRGEKPLKKIFGVYQASDVIAWFQSKGVELKVEPDGRMFPESNSSQTIIDCFLSQAAENKIQIETGQTVSEIKKEGGFVVKCESGKQFTAEKILVAIGGHPKESAYQFLETLGHTVKKTIPSLFTFNDTEKKFVDLMGLSVSKGTVKIVGTKFSEVGPVLITHWGLSGPAVIKLSAWAAEYLYQVNYQFMVQVNWVGELTEEEVRNKLHEYKQEIGLRKVFSNPQFDLPSRLWQRLCELAEINDTIIWSALPKKNTNRLIEFLVRTPFQIKGKTTFKEEFVTCGGIDLADVNTQSMESKKVRNLYFAGEVLDIDGETGGFNFQAAWSTGYLAAKSITA